MPVLSCVSTARNSARNVEIEKAQTPTAPSELPASNPYALGMAVCPASRDRGDEAESTGRVVVRETKQSEVDGSAVLLFRPQASTSCGPCEPADVVPELHKHLSPSGYTSSLPRYEAEIYKIDIQQKYLTGMIQYTSTLFHKVS